jgi:hypothetical protein
MAVHSPSIIDWVYVHDVVNVMYRMLVRVLKKSGSPPEKLTVEAVEKPMDTSTPRAKQALAEETSVWQGGAWCPQAV